MKFWRLTRAPFVALDGMGAQLHGTRYTDPGIPLVSLASEAGLAVLVALRYLPHELTEIPQDFVLGWTEALAAPERVPDSDDAAIRAWIAGWLAMRGSLLCAVTSKVLPEADVIYLNPLHPDAAHIRPLTTRPFRFEDCLHRPPMFDAFGSKR
ncbi:RES family NAD+ phosphorylase [Pontixanthobacter sp.]|uniref:RES family NAD+ phosphorylase n=1 Tax=Pontixanthobacter sp. TaxID=2792078 RepID=UPI003C7CCF2C